METIIDSDFFEGRGKPLLFEVFLVFQMGHIDSCFLDLSAEPTT